MIKKSSKLGSQTETLAAHDAEETESDPLESEDSMAPDMARPKSPLALEIAELQRVISKHIAQRERLPQPLFWSLFNSKVRQLKQLRAQQRMLSELLDP